MKKTFNFFIIVLFLIFMYIFLSSSGMYYEYSNNKKTIYTEEKIKEFEEDIKNGKSVNINNYIVNDSKDYSNKVTNLGDSLSEFINDSVNYVLKGGFKIIEKMVN